MDQDSRCVSVLHIGTRTDYDTGNNSDLSETSCAICIAICNEYNKCVVVNDGLI